MQVSQIAELDTHAVIGGGKAQAFGMSDSAEFFTVLSDTLYRDKKRAVIREVVCNAWDAHIMGGCTDRPVEITLTDEELVIRDFGPGIADDRIVPIYCVYGASTKVKDDTQTGGFGLGSKAPFAYSDHFSVTSCHAGFRTVYAISRGSAATQGKPDIRAMVRVPSEETGITVTIPLKVVADHFLFHSIVKSVVLQGGIRATLNGEELERNDYTEARKTGFCLVKNGNQLGESPVYVLYGTVLYPVTTTDQEIRVLVSQLDNIGSYGSRMVLIAPPNSIGVTPSREALSYSELTTDTIKRLLQRASRQIEHFMPAVAHEIMKARVASMERYQFSVDPFSSSNTRLDGLVADPAMIARISVESDFSGRVPSDRRDSLMMHYARKQFRDDRRVLRRLAGMIKAKKFSRYQRFTCFNFRDSSRLHIRLATKLGLLNRMMASPTSDYSGPSRLVSLEEIPKGCVASDVLIISPNQRDAYKEIRKRHDGLGYDARRKLTAYMVLVLQRPSPELLQAVEKEAKRLKIKTATLDFPQPKKRAKAEVLKTFYDFSKVKNTTTAYSISEAPTLETAPVYVRASGSVDSIRIDSEFVRSQALIAEVYPTVALVLNTRQEEKLRAAGARSLHAVALEDLKKLNATREVQYAFMTREELFVSEKEYLSYHSPVRTALSLAKKSSRFAKLLFPDRVTLSETAKRADKLLEILKITPHRMEREEINKNLAKTRNDLREASLKTFGSRILTKAEATERFKSFWLLDNNQISYLEDTKSDEVYATISFLLRRNSKSALTDGKKEAA